VQLLETARERGAMDVMNDFSVPFATRIAARLIGVPTADVPAMVGWVRRFFQHDPDHGSMTPDGILAIEEVNAYCSELAEARRRCPSEANDAVASLLAFEKKRGRSFSAEEAGMHLGMLVIGGSETIAKGMTLFIALLSRFPDQRRILLEDPTLITHAFHEALRYDNPTQFLCRTVARVRELHGENLREGQGVMLLYASGNRDERQFERPEVFDVARRPERILSFSAGEHLCLGIHLARLEARIAVEEILTRFPGYEVDFRRGCPPSRRLRRRGSDVAGEDRPGRRRARLGRVLRHLEGVGRGHPSRTLTQGSARPRGGAPIPEPRRADGARPVRRDAGSARTRLQAHRR
jgi:cytochrome P450